MIRLLVLLSFLFAQPAFAQQSVLPGFAPGVFGGRGALDAPSASYTGYGDLVASAKAYYGTRAYSAAEAAAGTQKVINVRNTGTNETCDVLVATNGGLASTVSSCSGSSSGTALSTFCSSCAITKAYDQSGASSCSGACDMSQVTAANQPTLTLSCQNSLPCMAFSGTQSFTGTFFTQAQQWTIAAAAKGSAAQTWIMARDSNWAVGFGSSANTVALYAGSAVTTATAANASYHSLIYLANGASSTINVDGTKTTVSPGGNGLSSTAGLGGDSLQASRMTGNILNVGVYGSGLSGANQTSLCNNDSSYWALGLGSC